MVISARSLNLSPVGLRVPLASSVSHQLQNVGSAERGPEAIGLLTSISSWQHHRQQALIQASLPNRQIPGLRFGSDSLWVRIFQPLTEDFMTAFFVRDIGGMGIPRSVNAANRGREVYEPDKDPKANKRYPFHQFAHATGQTIKGLNWGNMWEEVLREVQSGPAVFIGPTVVLAPVAAMIAGKSGLMMGRSDLKTYNQAFQDFVAQANPKWFQKGLSPEVLTRQLSESMMGQMLTAQFNPHGQAAVMQWPVGFKAPTPFYERPADQALHEFLKRPGVRKQYSSLNGTTMAQVSYQDAVKAWIKAWNQARAKEAKYSLGSLFTSISSYGRNSSARKAALNELNTLETAFKQLVYLSNTHHGGFHAAPEGLVALTVKNLEGPGKVSKIGVGGFLRNMDYFPKFIKDALSAGQLSTRGQYDVGRIIKAAQSIEQTVVKSKFIASLLATFMGFWAVGGISWIAQHSGKYPANRKVQFDTFDMIPGFTNEHVFKQRHLKEKASFSGGNVLNQRSHGSGSLLNSVDPGMGKERLR